MAADRSRLAAALAYKQAEEERRRRMLESIPTPAGTTPAQPAPQSDFRTNLENLSIGVGEGLTNQLEGIKGMVTDPVGTAKGVYEAGKDVVRDPAIIASALRQMGQKAMSGPLGAGEVIGEMIGPRKTGPVMAELDVYHGTPHRFPATEANPLGEFDASKIGTGEGAQAYGHGIYYAENPNVAQSYTAAGGSTTGLPQSYAADVVGMMGGEQKAIEHLKRIMPPKGEKTFSGESREFIEQTLRDVESGAYKAKQGSLYKADLPDEMIDRMLDWDKPLSEQRELATPILKELGYLRPNENGPRQFTQAVKALSLEHGGFGESGATGMGLFKAIYKGLEQGKPQAIDLAKRMNLGEQGMFMEASPLASEVMKRMGIPGIKYLDAGSRGQGGSGTRNFVVFPGEEKKVRILERDGQKAPPQKIAQALESAPDYRMGHRPMTVEGGAARLDNAYEVFGQDIYGPNALQYFGAGDPRETKTVAALKRLRDNPDAEVTIYRGVPDDATGGIAKGDWVTLDKDVAQNYANLKPGQKGKVLTMKVKAKDVTTWPDSLLEFGYYPAE